MFRRIGSVTPRCRRLVLVLDDGAISPPEVTDPIGMEASLGPRTNADKWDTRPDLQVPRETLVALMVDAVPAGLLGQYHLVEVDASAISVQGRG